MTILLPGSAVGVSAATSIVSNHVPAGSVLQRAEADDLSVTFDGGLSHTVVVSYRSNIINATRSVGVFIHGIPIIAALSGW